MRSAMVANARMMAVSKARARPGRVRVMASSPQWTPHHITGGAVQRNRCRAWIVEGPTLGIVSLSIPDHRELAPVRSTQAGLFGRGVSVEQLRVGAIRSAAGVFTVVLLATVGRWEGRLFPRAEARPSPEAAVRFDSGWWRPLRRTRLRLRARMVEARLAAGHRGDHLRDRPRRRIQQWNVRPAEPVLAKREGPI